MDVSTARISGRSRFSIPRQLADVVYVNPGGEVLIASGREADPRVRSWLLRQRALHGEVLPKSLPYNELQEVIRNSDSVVESAARDSEKIRLALDIQQHAASLRASDVHIRVFGGRHTRVYFRIDGQLQELTQWQMSAEDGEDLSRTIYQSLTNTARPSYVPSIGQDGQIDHPDYLAQGLAAIRCKTSPHKLGHMMVLRLLYNRVHAAKGSLNERLTAAGYSPDHVEMFRAMISRPKGLVLLAGETGSGKSTTLMHLLEVVHAERPGSNILTIEDPPEYDIDGAMQIPVVTEDDSESRSEAFVRAIRDALRLDPDAIMIGEVRDPASAVLAVQAAITGHLGFSTVHTNSCVDSLVRIYTLIASHREGGSIDPSMYLSNPQTIAGLCYQTLAPLLCTECRQPLRGNEQTLPRDVHDRMKEAGLLDFEIFLRGPGCRACQTDGARVTGIFGRTVVAETACTDAEYLTRFNRHDIVGAQQHWIEALGGRPIMAHALEKVASGLVDPVLMEQRVGRFEPLPRALWDRFVPARAGRDLDGHPR
jgi:general secretion pathway protein E